MTTTMAEPEWDEDARATAIALDRVDLCPLCGRPPSVCQDPRREFDWQALPPVRCHAHTARLRAQQQVTEETNPQSGALLWGVALAEEAPHG